MGSVRPVPAIELRSPVMNTSSATSTTAPAPPSVRRARFVLPRTWSGLLAVAAGSVAGAAVLSQVAGRFFGPSFAVLAVLTGTGAWLAGRRPRAAAWLVAVACALNLALHGGMLLLVVREPGQGLAVVLDAVNAVGSVLGIVAAVAVLLRRTASGPLPSRLAAAGLAVVGVAAVLTTSLYLARSSVQPADGEAVVRHSGLAVEPSDVVVTADDGSATLVVRNEDWLYPRSFDIDSLDIHEVIPPRTAVRIELPPTPATYSFYDFFTYTPATEGTVVVHAGD
jgi:Cupredoxin-like domain